jgi:hypothetical protein
MMKLTIDSYVLTKLKQAFPTPANSAHRALAKYVSALEGLLLNAVQRGIAPVQKKLGLYPLPLHELANKGGRIGPQKIRMHKWLKDNQLELIKTVEKGNKFAGEFSTVKLSSLVTLEDRMNVSATEISKIRTDRELDRYLIGEVVDSRAVFDHLYPELEPSSISRTEAGFDFVPVDIESLKAFVHWVGAGAEFGSKQKRQQILNQAKLVLAVASINGAMFPQRIKLSPFGRTYYEGISVQNVHKELRRAMLGNCWEYDIRSSVVAWKMGFASRLLSFERSAQDVRKSFPATTLYLEDKQDFMGTVRYFTFDSNTSLTTDFQLGLIKQALTAISFGAKVGGKGWSDGAGTWRNPALVEILQNSSERARFLSDPSVSAFIAEQKRLDDFLVATVKREAPQLLELPELRSLSGRINKAKVVSYLYQHAETAAMDCALAVSARYGHEPIARVHDAIFFRNRLGAELKSEIQFVMQESTANPYWHLIPKQIKRYTPLSLDLVTEEALHRRRIAAEELRAASFSFAS